MPAVSTNLAPAPQAEGAEDASAPTASGPDPRDHGMPDAGARDPAIRLHAISDTAAAPSLHRDLSEAAASGRHVLVSAHDVERITTACIQLLLAAEKSLARRGGGLVVRGVTDAMRAAFADLGLADDLAGWVNAHG